MNEASAGAMFQRHRQLTEWELRYKKLVGDETAAKASLHNTKSFNFIPLNEKYSHRFSFKQIRFFYFVCEKVFCSRTFVIYCKKFPHELLKSVIFNCDNTSMKSVFVCLERDQKQLFFLLFLLNTPGHVIILFSHLNLKNTTRERARRDAFPNPIQRLSNLDYEVTFRRSTT